MFRKSAVVLSVVCLLATAVGAQKLSGKSWSEWSKKDAEKVLDDSPWAQTQVETDTSEMFYSPTTQGQGRGATNSRTAAGNGTIGSAPTGNNRAEEGATNQATSVKFHIRFFSARPIRQALARQAALRQGGALTPQIKAFAESGSAQQVVIAVTFDSTDQRYGGKVMQAFNSAVTAALKNSTYLERKDGKRVFLEQYIPPTQNTLGAALFVFPRVVGERPLLSLDSGEVRFVAEFSDGPKLNMKYKVSEMIYDGKLEY
ncbi:MAG: hypothetical protein QOF61_3256 [Acidobacteriota bacterium]|jgi:hypothetical protein|nr:hypothetical protein [Acidobacteriota bacterium]